PQMGIDDQSRIVDKQCAAVSCRTCDRLGSERALHQCDLIRQQARQNTCGPTRRLPLKRISRAACRRIHDPVPQASYLTLAITSQMFSDLFAIFQRPSPLAITATGGSAVTTIPSERALLSVIKYKLSPA